MVSKAPQSTVICGSYSRHLREIYNIRVEFEGMGVQVLAPLGSKATADPDGFMRLDTDRDESSLTLQNRVFSKIRRCDFLTIVNPAGYLGRATIMEIGYAAAHEVPILTLEEVTDPNIR
jgi:nucleoside 2-deoxyribosyltransferase